MNKVHKAFMLEYIEENGSATDSELFDVLLKQFGKASMDEIKEAIVELDKQGLVKFKFAGKDCILVEVNPTGRKQ